MVANVSDKFEIKMMIKNSIFQHFRQKLGPNVERKLAKVVIFKILASYPLAFMLHKRMGYIFLINLMLKYSSKI